jgi:hypothetical protein
MKMIQCIADIEELKERGNLPLAYLKAIEQQFLEWYEAEGEGESLTSFRLPCPLQKVHPRSFLTNFLGWTFFYKGGIEV